MRLSRSLTALAVGALGAAAVGSAPLGADAASATPSNATRHCSYTTRSGDLAPVRLFPKVIVFGAPVTRLSATFHGKGVYRKDVRSGGNTSAVRMYLEPMTSPTGPNPIAMVVWNQKRVGNGTRTTWMIRATHNPVPPNGDFPVAWPPRGAAADGAGFVPGTTYRADGVAVDWRSPSLTSCPLPVTTFRVKAATTVGASIVATGSPNFSLAVVTRSYDFNAQRFVARPEAVRVLRLVDGTFRPASATYRTGADGTATFVGTSTTKQVFEVQVVSTTAAAGSVSKPVTFG